MNHFGVFFTALLLAGPGLLAQDEKPREAEGQATAKQAASSLRGGDYESAREDFSSLLKASPEDEGLARGTGDQDVLVLDAGIRADASVSVGEVVTTSGGRSLFPADIPVGRVSDSDDDTEFRRTIVVKLAAGLENLSFLNVVIGAPGLGEGR